MTCDSRRALQILLQKRDIIRFRLRTVLCRLAVGIITQERDLLVIRLGALHIGLHRRTAALGLLPGDIAPPEAPRLLLPNSFLIPTSSFRFSKNLWPLWNSRQ